MSARMDKVIGVRLASAKDLVRLAASSAASGQSIFILRMRHGDSLIYGVLAVFRDFFKLYGVPLLYYFVDDSGEIPPQANYASLKVEGDVETIKFGVGAEAGYISIPIINLERPPEFLNLEELL